ncbi:hypothetical protein [Streptomyces sp. NPDC088180]|uniref:hypothetical protein n=1 Tax=Streptomyces sp. NPDC088180 TaxID=3365837 RepID=UPI0037F59CD4
MEFVYRATADDFEVALRAGALLTGAGRLQAFAVPVASVGAPAVVGLSAPVLFGGLVVCAVAWAVHREYLETARLFVLLGGERSAGIAVVPKRGAQGPEDVERLRAILGWNLRRLWRSPASGPP